MSVLKKKLIIFFAVVLLLTALSSVLLKATTLNGPAETPQPLVESRVSQPDQEAQESDQKGMWIMVGRDGFAVKEWTVPAGEYFVVIQNATGLKELSLTIDGPDGQRVQEIHLPSTKRLWRQKMQLSRGTYIVRETAHPEWTARITVE